MSHIVKPFMETNQLARVTVEEAYRCGYEAGVKAERERCANMCEEMAESPALVPIETYRALFIASMIRDRGNDD